MITINSDINIEYEYSGLFRTEESWIHRERIINNYEIIFMLNGTAYIAEDNLKYTVNPGDFLILNPGRRHYGYKETLGGISFYWLHFNTCEKYMAEFPKYGNPSMSGTLKNLFSQLLHTANTPGYTPACCDLLTALIAEEIRRQSGSDSNVLRPIAARIKEWVRINISSAPTVKRASAHFGYHENYIGKVFREAYGIGFKEYINQMQLENIKGYLAATDYTVKQIAHLCGFESENVCIKFFKYHTGMTPTEYRSMNFNTHMNKK